MFLKQGFRESLELYIFLVTFWHGFEYDLWILDNIFQQLDNHSTINLFKIYYKNSRIFSLHWILH